MKRLLAILLLLLLPSVLAVGISPASVELTYDEAINKSLTFYAINNEKIQQSIELYVGGDLSKYVTLSVTKLNLAPDEIKSFTAKFSLPSNLSAGTYETIIGARNKGGLPSGTGMSTAVAAEALVFLKKLFGFETIGLSIKVEKVANNSVRFVLNVEQQPNNLSASGVIYGPRGNIVGNVSFPSFVNQSTAVIWNAPEKGSYRIVATAKWNNKSEDVETNFQIGQPHIEILNVSIMQKGQTAAIDILAKSDWNDLLDVWAEAKVFDGEEQITSSRSENIAFDAHEEKHIRVYVEQSNISGYDIDITLHYAGLITNKRISASRHITEKLPSAKTSLTGALAALLEPIEPIHIVIIILFVILLALVYIYFKEPKRPRQTYQQYPYYYQQYPYYYDPYYYQYDPYWYWRR